MHKFHHDNAHRLESEQRYALIPPNETLSRFGLRAGMMFCDIGSGTGFFSRAAADIVGPAGAVHACDMSEEMLAYFRGTDPPSNVTIHRSEEYSIPFPDAGADLTLLAFVIHENPDAPRFLREALRITKPSGRVLIIEWKKQVEETGPAMEERLDKEDARAQLAEFRIVEEGELNQSHYYFLIAHPEGVSRLSN